MPQILVNRLRRALSRTHGEDDRSRAGNDVTAGKDAFTRGDAVLIRHDAAVLVDIQSLRGGVNQWVR